MSLPKPLEPELESPKVECLSSHIRVRPDALDSLGGPSQLAIHEYATTRGIGFELDHQLFLNAAFDDWRCDEPNAVFYVANGGRDVARPAGHDFRSPKVFQLPGYSGERMNEDAIVVALDENGRRIMAVRFNESEPVRHICGISGGKESSALAAFLRDAVPDMEYFICDTGAELPETDELLFSLKDSMQRNRTERHNWTLMEVLAGSHDDENDAMGCNVCHL